MTWHAVYDNATGVLRSTGSVIAEAVDTTTFPAAFAAATGGETFELAPGDYGVVDIRNRLFLLDVTIVSADPANPAIVRGLDVRDSSHLVFDGILFDYVVGPTYADSTRPFEVMGSAYITIRNSVFDGDEVPSEIAPGEYGTGIGLNVHSSDNVVIENNEFSKFWKALSVGLSTNTVVRGNDVHTIRADGFNFVAVYGLLAEGNYLHDFKTIPGSSDHGDMIQSWQINPDHAPMSDVIIRGNFLDAGIGNRVQSIFLRNELADRGGDFETLAYRDILIEDNVIYNAHLHGITVGETVGLVVRNNTILFDGGVSDELPPGNNAPRMNLAWASLNVTVEGNISEATWNWEALTDQPGWTAGNNLFVQHTDPDGENYYGDLFVNALVAAPSLADLRATPGGVIELGGFGAAMTRADIPLLVGPYAVPPPPVIPAEIQVALDALQAQVDANANQVALAAVQAQINAAGINAAEAAAASLAARVLTSEGRITAGAAGLAGVQ